jgi:hypothetical protein
MPTVRALAAGSALLGLGCERITALLEQKAQEVADEMTLPEATPPAGPVLSDDEQLAAKLALYTECRGRASRRIRQSYQRYDARVLPDGTPRKKDQEPYLHQVDTELTPCDEAAAKGPHTAPPLPELEATMAAWLAHARAFAATAADLDEYYESKGYTQDAWAKGKALAPGFAATYAAWVEADDELAALVEARMEVVERALLAEVEARKGQDIEWHSRHVVLAAKAFVRCFVPPVAADPKAEGKPGQKPPKAPAPACDDELTALLRAEAGFRREYETNRDAANAVFWMSAFEASVTDLVEKAQAVTTARPGSKGGPTAEDRQALVEEHRELVSDAANLRFER